MKLSDYFEDQQDDEFPIVWVEELGEHTISETIRRATVWASLQKFVENLGSDLDETKFSDREKSMSRYVQFHGPYTDLQAALEESKKRRGILVAPRHLWEDKDEEFVYIAVLAN